MSGSFSPYFCRRPAAAGVVAVDNRPFFPTTARIAGGAAAWQRPEAFGAADRDYLFAPYGDANSADKNDLLRVALFQSGA